MPFAEQLRSAWRIYGWRACVIAAAIAVGAGAGRAMVRGAIYSSDTADAFIYNGPWFTTRYAGSADADAWTRALVAATGLLALPREETIYYRLHKDEDGRPLSSEYDYVLRGSRLPARWWSLTLYDSDNFLNRDARGPYSVKSTTLETGLDGAIEIVLSSDPQTGNWIDMGTGQNMSVSMRVYNPDLVLVENMETAALFSIERVEKRENGE